MKIDHNDFPSQDDVLRDAGIEPGPAANTQPSPTQKKKEPAAPPIEFLTQAQIIREAERF